VSQIWQNRNYADARDKKIMIGKFIFIWSHFVEQKCCHRFVFGPVGEAILTGFDFKGV
jgi:hypothetical protein